MMKTASMERLARRARSGDREAFVELMESCKLSLIGVARSILHSEEDVADAMQETALDAFERLSSLKKPAYVKTWLTRILLNNCYDLLRRNRTVPFDPFTLSEGDESQSAEYDWDTSLDVRDTLGELAQSEQLLLTLFYVEDMSQKDIGRLLGLKENAVKQRLARAKRHFRCQYEKGSAVNE